MEKYYARVKFSFGTYTFYTFDSSLMYEDTVACVVKNYIQVGEFVEYIKDFPKGVEIKPIYGAIEGIIYEFENKKAANKEQENMKVKREYRIYGECGFYKPGDIVLANGVVWEYDGMNFFHVCTKKEWDERDA